MFIFFFVVWFWILIRVLMDLFRRSDMSGIDKVLWVIFLRGAALSSASSPTC